MKIIETKIVAIDTTPTDNSPTYCLAKVHKCRLSSNNNDMVYRSDDTKYVLEYDTAKGSHMKIISKSELEQLESNLELF
jgi:hypothetical protein